MDEVKEGHALNHDREKLSKTYKFSSQVENEAIELVMIWDRITKLQDKLDVVQKALDRLKENERKVLSLRYIERNRWGMQNSWKEISYKMHYDRSWCAVLHDRGIESMLVCMFKEIEGI